MREDLNNAKKELNQLKNESLAMELIRLSNKDKKRLFIMWILTFIILIGLVGYIIYIKSNEITNTSEISIEDVETIDSSTIKIGDDIWEKSQ